MKTRSSIWLADDHVLVAQGIQKLLEPEFELLGVVPDGRALLKALDHHPSDLAIVDISLPLLNGLDASRHIRKQYPSIKIIILTMHAESTFVTEALRIGVVGYVLKQSVGSELVEAIHQVMQGKTFVSPMSSEPVTDASSTELLVEPKGFALTLSQRQREVLQLVAEGKSIKEVAAILEVSIKTVEFHKTRLMKQLKIRSAAQLTKYAISNGLITIH
ncbi:MAG TPA: response regulator transcription factor [Nitrospira sp.]|nr:response regulator transcription factor [Nitrospira sp.]